MKHSIINCTNTLRQTSEIYGTNQTLNTTLHLSEEKFFVLLPENLWLQSCSDETGQNKVFSFIRNRISVGKLFLAIFIIFIIFIDENSCIQRIKYDAEINDLRKQIAAQNDTTEYYNRRIEELKTDKNIIEQVAREQYLMSKPNEDIYLIENKK